MPRRHQNFERNSDGRRKRVWPRLHWLQDVEDDLRALDVVERRRAAKDKFEWRRIVEA